MRKAEYNAKRRAQQARKSYAKAQAKRPNYAAAMRQDNLKRGKGRPVVFPIDPATIARGAVKRDWRGMTGHRYRPVSDKRTVKISNGGESYVTQASKLQSMGTQADVD